MDTPAGKEAKGLAARSGDDHHGEDLYSPSGVRVHALDLP